MGGDRGFIGSLSGSTPNEKLWAWARTSNSSVEGNRAWLDAMWASGAEVNAPNPQGCNALHLACMSGSLEKVDYLLARGADVQAVSHEKIKPIYWAVSGSHNAIISRLLEYGANPNLAASARTFSLRTMLNHLHSGNPALKLLDAGAQMGPDLIRWARSLKVVVPLRDLCARLDHAEAWLASVVPDVAALTPDLMCGMANLGRCAEALERVDWNARPADLHRLLAQLPPYLSDEIVSSVPKIAEIVASKAPKTLVWGEKLTENPVINRVCR